MRELKKWTKAELIALVEQLEARIEVLERRLYPPLEKNKS